MSIFYSFTFLFFISACTSHKNVEPVSFNYGVMTYGPLTTKEKPDYVGGKHSYTSTWEIIHQTGTIYPQLGMAFGLEYRLYLKEIPNGHIREIVRFPEGGLTNPETGRTMDQEVVEKEYVYPYSKDIVAYVFSEKWEMKPGEWTFAVYLNEKEMISKTFYVKDRNKNIRAIGPKAK